MSTLVQSLIALALIWVFAYRRARMSTILVSVLVLLLAMTFYAGFAWLPWLLLLLVGFFYIATDLRMQLMTQPLYKFFRSVLPPMSRTEMEALEAGDVWWEVELFQGDPDWDELLNYPKPELSEAE